MEKNNKKAAIPEFKPSAACEKCKGACCKHMACHFAPSDFTDLSYDALKAEIERGFISIDWWEDDRPEYFLRMRHVDAPIVDPSWGGRCMLLTDSGCPLPFEQRPLGARALKPVQGGNCEVFYSKEDCKNDWMPYHEILSDLVVYFEEVE